MPEAKVDDDKGGTGSELWSGQRGADKVIQRADEDGPKPHCELRRAGRRNRQLHDVGCGQGGMPAKMS